MYGIERVEEVLTATGYIVPQLRAVVSSRISGRLDWRGVDLGSRVKAGDVIAVRDGAKTQLRIVDALQLADKIGFPSWVQVDVTRTAPSVAKTLSMGGCAIKVWDQTPVLPSSILFCLPLRLCAFA